MAKSQVSKLSKNTRVRPLTVNTWPSVALSPRCRKPVGHELISIQCLRLGLTRGVHQGHQRVIHGKPILRGHRLTRAGQQIWVTGLLFRFGQTMTSQRAETCVTL